ncbi:response regulator [Cohnella fermenti]|uniref:response regulator n=1 Tax=Cohnella fermenti TaxID=2565925 RepID=UPI001454C597|nr:response regulator [Cohnella fermenti]
MSGAEVQVLRAILIDDEQPALDILRVFLEQDGRLEVAGSYRRAKDALDEAGGLKPDVAFIDIEMTAMNGLELAEKLIARIDDIEIVFTTAFDKYALDAFKYTALHYILKPLTPEAVWEAVNRLYRRKGKGTGNAERETPAAGSSGAAKNSTLVRLFGGFRIQGPNGSPVHWRTAKTKELFAFLVLRGGSFVSKWDILDSLWPDSDEERAHTNLYTTVYKLRKALREASADIAIEQSMENYGIRMGDSVWVDAEELKKLALSASPLDNEAADRHRAVLHSYEGELLAGWDSLWCVSEQEKFAQRFRSLSLRLAVFELERGRLDDAEPVARKLLEQMPLDEEANGMLLTIYARKKDRVSFLRHYERMSKLFESELGLSPQPSIRKLYEKMMEAAP